MAGDDPREPSPHSDPTEEKLLRRLRLIAGAVVLVMLFGLATVDTFGRLYVNPEFHASELIFGSLLGALLLILGIEAVNRLPGGRK